MITAEAPSQTSPARFQIIPALDRMPRVVSFAQTAAGKVAMVAAFALITSLVGFGTWREISTSLLVLAFLPSHRLAVILVATLVCQMIHDPPGLGNPSAILRSVGAPVAELVWPSWMDRAPLFQILVLVFGIAYLLLVRRSGPGGARGPMRRPLATWLTMYGALILVASCARMPAAASACLWAFLIVLGKYLWYIGYSILDVAHSRTLSVPGQLAYWRPFWGGTNTPFPRGAAYLRKIEAKTPGELAVTQLKGLKLVMWMSVLAILHQFLLHFVHGDPARLPWWVPGTLGIPTFQASLQAHVAGTPYPVSFCWLAVLTLITLHFLTLAVVGHMIIGTCRLAGYRALRNTYRPLEATSFADFYNRYYFYYKELLVHFFFFPAYARYFRKSPRMRIVFATMAAACLGNGFYHFTRDIHNIIRYGLFEALVRYHVLIVYFVTLGLVLAISQMRDMAAAKARQPSRPTLIRTLVILTFYGLTIVIAYPDPELTILHYGSYLLRLVVPGGGG